ncbi:MAG: acetyl-CoA carboxylase biotin carboxyl carrier protein [Inconstantimicrobium porci]|uniref:acetyl-CoA carboxylase biotin carboxyl carrier protein n=1 Tax=Inconstantimicrobium porci TaxID=2652291 RepID=UPI002A91DCFB|nr:acetyl-CoA carboxylase biotin carboxyl carrier protein [Inconstantimicrobium porci]MDY5913368.1 acetyl-CoA carboxylase biotin carboxyl carrier protein [Inconstantimicrobium porci]
MNIEDVNKIIDKIDKSSLSFFELDIENCHIKIDKSEVRSYAASGVVAAAENKVVQNYAPDMNIKSNANAGNSIANTTDAAAATVDEDDSVVVVKAPIVGTFYGAPSPDSDNFVSVGSKVKKGDTLCIIESMKLMNEIESEEDGEVVAIIANDKAMVEYGQPLFKIRRA